jgi:hypothetical protein
MPKRPARYWAGNWYVPYRWVTVTDNPVFSGHVSRRQRDEQQLRLRRLCTDRGKHAVRLLDEARVPIDPVRPALGSIVLLRAALEEPFPPCPKCGRHGRQGIVGQDEASLRELERSVAPGCVARWDVSTRQLLDKRRAGDAGAE